MFSPAARGMHKLSKAVAGRTALGDALLMSPFAQDIYKPKSAQHKAKDDNDQLTNSFSLPLHCKGKARDAAQIWGNKGPPVSICSFWHWMRWFSDKKQAIGTAMMGTLMAVRASLRHACVAPWFSSFIACNM